MKAFAERLKELRTGKKLTQQQMADVLNVLRSTYGEYERGKIAPPMDKLQILANHFGVTIDYLIGNSNRKTNANETPTTDIRESISRILDALQTEGDVLTFDGDLLTKDSRELIISTLENSLKMAKLINKK